MHKRCSIKADLSQPAQVQLVAEILIIRAYVVCKLLQAQTTHTKRIQSSVDEHIQQIQALRDNMTCDP